MVKKNYSSGVILLVCLLSILFIPLLAQNSRNSEAEIWTMISCYLDCFLADPITNIPLLKKVDDLPYWTSIYFWLKEKSVLKETFSKHFLIGDIDEVQLDAMFRLLKAYSSPISYERLKPIIFRIIEISSIKPEWFARNLLLRDDWREITRLIVKGDFESIVGQRKGLRDIMSILGDTEVKKQLMDFFIEIDNEKHEDVEKFREFMKDPSANLGKIMDIYDLCATMGPIYKDKSFDILVEWINKDTDEKKIRVLFQIMNHCDGAYHLEVIQGIAEEAFIEHQPRFVSALKDELNWRSIILSMSYGLYDRDKEFIRSLSTLGKSDFEMRIRSQLEFLRENLNYEH